MDFDWRHDTGPIDLFDLSNPEVKALVSTKTKVDENGALHDVKGRFTFKDKPLEYKELVPEVRQPKITPFGAQGVSYSVQDTSLDRNIHISRETLADGSERVYENGKVAYIGIRPRQADGSHIVYPDDKRFRKLNAQPVEQKERTKKPAVTPAMIRQWGRDNGYLVGDRGKLPPALVQAYHQAHR